MPYDEYLTLTCSHCICLIDVEIITEYHFFLMKIKIEKKIEMKLIMHLNMKTNRLALKKKV